jgi:mono/diheme cytochrome c family protein
MNTFLPRRSSGMMRPSQAERDRPLRPAHLWATTCFVALSAAAILGPFSAIVRAQTTGAAPKPSAAPAGNTENGKRLFGAQACNNCHGDRGQGSLPNPENEGAAPRIGPTRLSPPGFLGFVRNPIGRMPPYASKAVSDAEIADLYAFLQSLAPTPKAEIASANLQNGQRLFTSYGCYECHGNEGQGSTQTGGSRIGPVRIPFPAFVIYIRQPTAQMPPYAVKAVSDADLADIYAFLQSRPESAPAKSIPLLNQ